MSGGILGCGSENKTLKQVGVLLSELVSHLIFSHPDLVLTHSFVCSYIKTATVSIDVFSSLSVVATF